MKLLAIDTAMDACSVALLINDQIIERVELAPRKHAQLIMPMIESVLNEAAIKIGDLDVLSFGCGPASFTGIRIAAGIIQGLAFASDLPVVPVSTLQTLAQGAYRELDITRSIVCLDAKMDEVYWGAYEAGENGIVDVVIEDQLLKPHDVVPPEQHAWVGVGDGFDRYSSILSERCGKKLSRTELTRYPNARDVADIAAVDFGKGSYVSSEQAIPVYLRDKNAWPRMQ